MLFRRETESRLQRGFPQQSIPGAMRQASMRTRLWRYLGQIGAHRSRVSPRGEFRRPFPVHNRARHRKVGKFLTIRDATQHQSTATHVTAADKLRRKSQSLAKVGQQHVDIFAGGDVAKEDHFALGRQCRCQMTRVALEWHSVTRIVLIDVDLRKFTQMIETNSRSGIDLAPRARRHHAAGANGPAK